MGSTPKKPRTDDDKQVKTDVTYRGVRMRTWGMWVSEIRVPMSKERIWLGSYDDPEKAARAYDAALYCLRGSDGIFNFPDDERPVIPGGSSSSLSTAEIKEVAARFASPDKSVLPSTSPLATKKRPQVEGRGTKGTITSEIGDSPFKSGLKEHDSFFSDSYLRDVPITHEPNSIWALLDEIKNSGEEK